MAESLQRSLGGDAAPPSCAANPLLAAVMFAAIGWNLAWGQSTIPGRDRPARIGVLFYSSRVNGPAEHPLFVGLREVGLLDGRNATLIIRDAEGQPERLPQLAAELVAAGPDVIITAGPQAVQAAKAATTTIPIVFAIISDPISYGVVASLAHPGGNLTGLSMVNTLLTSKRLELLKETAPWIARVAVFTDPTMGKQGLPETTIAAHALGLDLRIRNTPPTEFDRAFAEALSDDAQALLIMPSPFFNIHELRQHMAEQALRQKLPSMCEEVSYVRAALSVVRRDPDFRRDVAPVRRLRRQDLSKVRSLPIFHSSNRPSSACSSISRRRRRWDLRSRPRSSLVPTRSSNETAGVGAVRRRRDGHGAPRSRAESGYAGDWFSRWRVARAIWFECGRFPPGTERHWVCRWTKRDDRIPLGGGSLRSSSRIGNRPRQSQG